MLRKAALVAVLAFVPAEQGDLRVFIGLGVLQIPLLLQLKFRPFRTALQNRLESFALIATFLTLFVGQAISLEILPEPEQQERAAEMAHGIADMLFEAEVRVYVFGRGGRVRLRVFMLCDSLRVRAFRK